MVQSGLAGDIQAKSASRFTGAAPMTKKGVVAEFRRSEILEAARKVFARCGYRSTCVDEIAKVADIAKGTLYLYFKSKEEIYLTALIADVHTLHGETLDRVGRATTVRDKVREFIAVRAEHSDRHADFWRIYFLEFPNLANRSDSMSKQFQAVLRSNIKLLRDILQKGIASGEIVAVPAERTAYAINDLTRCIIERRLTGFVKSSAAADTAFAMDLLWHGLVPANRKANSAWMAPAKGVNRLGRRNAAR